MPRLSIRLPDSDYEQLHILRGNMTVSDYIRKLIASQRDETKKEVSDFTKLFHDVRTIRETLVALSDELPNQKALIALADYVKEVVKISNPPAYANYADKLQELLQKLKADLKG